MSNMDEIVKLHKDRMRSLEKCFQGEVKKLHDDFEREKAKVLEKFSREKEELEAVISAIEKEENERDAEVQCILIRQFIIIC